MGGACNTHTELRNAYKILIGKPEGKRLLGTSSCRWEGNNKMDFKQGVRVYPKVSGLSHNEIYAYLWYCSLRSNTKSYGSRTHQTDSQNSDTTALVAESSTICSSCSRWPVRKLLDTPSQTECNWFKTWSSGWFLWYGKKPLGTYQIK
jgi:hypothetical protein